MLIFEKIIKEEETEFPYEFLYEGKGILETSVFLDLEHYIFRKPICIGIFGAACVRDGDLICTQYMLQNRRDLKGLVRSCFDYLKERKSEGYSCLVTFAGANDIMVLNAMAERFHLDPGILKEFIHIDIQREFRKKHHVTTGLKTIEEIMGIVRNEGAPSGMSIAKTFARIMKEPEYSDRMDKAKIRRLIEYNREDVVNLYSILKNFNGKFDEKVSGLKAKREAEAEKRAALKLINEEKEEKKSKASSEE